MRTRIKTAEKLLSQIQARTPAADQARACLIRQLHYAAQIMAAKREGTPYRKTYAAMEVNAVARERALKALHTPNRRENSARENFDG